MCIYKEQSFFTAREHVINPIVAADKIQRSAVQPIPSGAIGKIDAALFFLSLSLSERVRFFFSRFGRGRSKFRRQQRRQRFLRK